MSEEYNVGEISEEEKARQLKRYGVMDMFESSYDDKTQTMTLKSKYKLTPEEQKTVDKAVKLIGEKYGVVIKKLGEK